MSKLYSKYCELKRKNSQTVYIFKSGIFYICLDDDAKYLSNFFNLKLTNLNESVLKCGFPVSRLDHYIRLLNSQNVQFQIIDPNYSNIDNYSDYLNNEKLRNIIEDIIKIDFDNISFKDAYELLYDFSSKLKTIN